MGIYFYEDIGYGIVSRKKLKTVYGIKRENNCLCMFPTLFPYGLGAPKMTCQKIKVSIEAHVKYFMNLDDKDHGFVEHHLSIFFMFNLIQHIQICLGTKINYIKIISYKRISTFE